MPYSISRSFEIAAAHHIPGHPGDCRRLHGHTYRLVVHVAARQLDALGMVLDFAALKQAVEAVAGGWDHRVLNEIPPFDRLSPTAEVIAEEVYRGVSGRIDDERVRVEKVEVWESSRSRAVYVP